MKKITFAAIALLVASVAWATPKGNPNGTPPPFQEDGSGGNSSVVSNPTSTSNATAGAAAGALAGALSGSASNSQSTAFGGHGGKGGDGGNGLGLGFGGGANVGVDGKNTANNTASTGSISNNSVSDESSKTFVAPAPSVALVPSAYGCIVTSNVAGGIGWNFVSGANAQQKSDPVCAGLKLAEEMDRRCQFLNASLLRERVTNALFPQFGPLPATPGLANLSPSECRALASK